MAYALISVKCPDCGQTLSIEENRTQAFCTYCGAKILISNENEYVIRKIDEAGIQQAETDRMIKMRQLRMEEKEIEGHKYLVIVWIVITVILGTIGIIGAVTNNDSLAVFILLALCVGMWGGLFLFSDKKKRTRVIGSDEAVITSAMTSHTDKQYSVIKALFTAAGFRHVTAVPMKDLSILSFGREGKVADVTIDGATDFEEGDVISKNAQIIITYHSKK